MASVVVDGNGGGGPVVTELLGHIKELVTQLEVHLGGSSPDLCKHLASQISSVTERSLSLLITTAASSSRKRAAAAVGSPLSDLKATKKRKTSDKKRHEVKVGGGDHPADDGHSWRKYGQKEILGAKHPRSYYRCTHRRSQGCAATKQVQRTDEDPDFFDVVYLGDHTCVQSAAAAAPESKCNDDDDDTGAGSFLQILSSSLTVKTEHEQGQATVEAEQQVQGSDLPPATASGCLSTSENWGVSPATSDSNHAVSFPPLDLAGAGDDVQFGFLGQVVSAAIDTADGDVFVDDLDIYVSSFLA